MNEAEKKSEFSEKKMTLRLPIRLATEIEAILSKKIIPTSRHSWILEAILEKIQREKKDFSKKDANYHYDI